MIQKISTEFALVVILILVGFFGGIVWMMSRQLASPTQQETVRENNQKAKVESKTGEDSAGWKIYQNDKYGFEFRYPAGGMVKTQDANDACINLTLEGLSINISNSSDCYPLRTGVGIGTDIKVLPGEDMIIDGKTYILRTREYITDSDSEKEDTFEGSISIGNVEGRVESIYYSYRPQQAQTFKQILATFKITK